MGVDGGDFGDYVSMSCVTILTDANSNLSTVDIVSMLPPPRQFQQFWTPAAEIDVIQPEPQLHQDQQLMNHHLEETTQDDDAATDSTDTVVNSIDGDRIE